MKTPSLLLLLLLLLFATCLQARTDKEAKKTKEDRRTRPNRVTPNANPEAVKDGGRDRRRSRLDYQDLRLDDNEVLDLQLMKDESPMKFQLKMLDFDDDPFTSFSSVNHTSGERVTFITSLSRDGRTTVMGTVHNANGTIFQIRQLADKELIVEEVKGGFDPEFDGGIEVVSGENDLPPTKVDIVDGFVENPNGSRGLRPGKGRRLLDDGSVIDVMVLYTKGSMCAAAGFGSGGKCSATAQNMATIEGLINLAVSETNTAYANSNIPTKLRLVKVHYDDSYDDYTIGWETTLAYMKGSTDGYLDYIHSMRNQYGADFVSMFVDTGSYCGIGFRPDNPTANDAFSLTKWSCATGYYSFGHEIAHNMGCNHDKNNAAGSGTNFGYQYTAGSSYNSRFRTIMSYDCSNGCPRVQRFSDPYGNYNGKAAGSSATNNAAWIRARIATYAQYRSTQPNTGTNIQLPVTASTPTMPPFPAPTMPPTNQRMLETTLDGGFIGGAGSMFDVRAKVDLSVNNFAVHSYSATTATVEIRKKKTPGSCQGISMKKDEWELIATVTFVTKEATIASVLPSGSFPPVFVKAGTLQSFYLTFQETTNYNRYSGGTTLGAVYKQNNDIEILEGYAKGYNFGDDYFPRTWNGQVFYEIGTTQPPTSPIAPPVAQPVVVPTPLPTPAPVPQPVVVPTLPPVPGPVSVLRPQNLPTPSIVAVPTSKLTTLFAGGNGQAGNMFDVTTNKAIVVKSFDIHTYSTSSVRVLVFTKKGTYAGFEKNRAEWTQICDTRVFGLGSPNPTPIPKEAVIPVTVAAGETQAFYVTLTESKIRYTNGIVNADDGTLRIIQSSGNKYPFGDFYQQRIWNGVLYYDLAGSSASQPTVTPPDGSYGPLKQHQTTFANKNGSFGSMWDIKAKEDLIIQNIWVHTFHQFGKMVEVEVYKIKAKNTSFQGKANSATEWELVGSATVEGQGTGVPTKLPPGTLKAITVAKGDIQGLYVTIIGGGLRYTNGKSTSTLLPFSETADMIVYEGAGIGSPRFGGAFNARVFNGVIEYSTPNASSSTSTSDVEAYNTGGKVEEGWPCEKNEDCKSGMCSDEEEKFKKDSITVTGLLDDKGKRLLTEKTGAMRLCLNEDGVHDEDGEYGGLQ